MLVKYEKKSIISFLLYILLYRLTLDFSYSKIVSLLYAYQGFENNFTIVNEAASLIILFGFSTIAYYFYENVDNKASNEILLLLFLMSFVPFTSMFGFGAFAPGFIISNILFWLFLILFVTIPIKKISMQIYNEVVLKFGEQKLRNETRIKFLTIGFGLVVIFISGVYTGFRFNFSLANVYDLRSEARGYNLPVLLAYIFSWTRTVNPIFIAYYLHKKYWGWVIFCFIVQLLNFGIDGSKTTLFLALFAIVVNLTPGFTLQSLNKWIVKGFFGLSFLTTIFYIGFSDLISFSVWPVSLFVRRVLYLPVYLGSNYFDFFTSHTPDYFRQSFMRLFGFVSPYDDLSYMIGEIYFHTVTSANNGLIADAITNMGIAGIVLSPMLYAVVLRVLNFVSCGIDYRLYITVAMYLAVTLVNSFLFRVLLTHGLLIIMVILYLISNSGTEKGQQKELIRFVMNANRGDNEKD